MLSASEVEHSLEALYKWHTFYLYCTEVKEILLSIQRSSDLSDDCSIWSSERSCPHSTSWSLCHGVRTPVSLTGSHRINAVLCDEVFLVRRQSIVISWRSVCRLCSKINQLLLRAFYF